MAELDRHFRGTVGGGEPVVGTSRRARDCRERLAAYAQTAVCPGPVSPQRPRVPASEPVGLTVGSGVPAENCGLLVSRAAGLHLLLGAIVISMFRVADRR